VQDNARWRPLSPPQELLTGADAPETDAGSWIRVLPVLKAIRWLVSQNIADPGQRLESHTFDVPAL
jgi:hypothetical protein